MSQSGSSEPPVTPRAGVGDVDRPCATTPPAVLALCAEFESHGLASALHGDAVLDTLRPGRRVPCEDLAPSLPAIVCAADPDAVLRVLPRAVVTAEGGVRLTQPTDAGPVDVLGTGARSLDEALPRFALGPLAIGYRPARNEWIDPTGQLESFRDGRLRLSRTTPDPFLEAPRRFWLAARLIAEYGLTPDDDLVARARKAFGEVVHRLPQGAPARRALTRILMSADPQPALAFLDRVGVTAEVAAGALPVHAERLAALPRMPAVRWAVWLRGAATARAMVTFRMPHALARRIERLQACHPLDRVLDGDRETSLRRMLARLSADEVDALLLWRRVELASERDRDGAARAVDRLDAVEVRLSKERERAAEGARVRTLAVDGDAVMARLGNGPGRHVGLALAHLARFVADDATRNDPARLHAELDAWAEANPDLLPVEGAPRRPPIG